jgi:hypothetical protein
MDQAPGAQPTPGRGPGATNPRRSAAPAGEAAAGGKTDRSACTQAADAVRNLAIKSSAPAAARVTRPLAPSPLASERNGQRTELEVRVDGVRWDSSDPPRIGSCRRPGIRRAGRWAYIPILDAVSWEWRSRRNGSPAGKLCGRRPRRLARLISRRPLPPISPGQPFGR